MATKPIQTSDSSPQQNDASNLTRTHSSTSETQLQHSSNALPALASGTQFLPALERLCSSKNTVQLTRHAAETWAAALSVYGDRPKVVNLAIVELAVSPDPFPDLGKLMSACERIRRTQDSSLPQDATQVRFKNITALAKAWGLET